ncbi:MAG: PIN domain-containing protein [Ferruginibacter sp.]
MKIFLDANILVSVLNKEYPLYTHTARILSLVDDKKFTVYTSPICLAIAFYFSEKKSGTAVARNKMAILANKLSIAEVNQTTVQLCIANKKINDFEDGLEYYAAEKNKCKVIITEDRNDFYFSEIDVLTSKDFTEKYLLK